MFTPGVLLWLGLSAIAADGALEVERAQSALEGGAPQEARAYAIDAVRQGGGVGAWTVYAQSAEKSGLWELARVELDASMITAPELALVKAAHEVRRGEADLAVLEAVAQQVPEPGRAVLAAVKWEGDRTLAAWLLQPLPDRPMTEEEARLRLRVYAVAGHTELAAEVAQSWLRLHPEEPDVIEALFEADVVSRPMERLRGRLVGRIARRMSQRWDDPLYLYRAHRVFTAAGDPRAIDVAARIGELGFRAPTLPRERGRARLAATRTTVDQLRGGERFDEAVRAWADHREAGDSFEAALEHGRLLQVLDRPTEAWDIALVARNLAAGATPGDAGCLDAAAHGARIADAHGLLAELALTLGHPRAAREAATVARNIDPHPRWVALLAQAEIVPTTEGDDGLPRDERVRAVVDSFLHSTDFDIWEIRARMHEEQGEPVAAFVAWVVARAHGADIADALARNWDGIGTTQIVAEAALEAYHASRRSYREDLAAIRDADEGNAPIIPVAVAPGPGLLLPKWTATTADGREVTSEDYRGQPYVLAVWASWCMPCLEELPLMNREVHILAKDGMRIPVVAVSVDERQSVFERRARAGGWEDLELAWSADLASQLGVDGLPTNFAVDAEGRIVHLERGYSEPGVKRLLQHVVDSQP